MNRIPRPPAQRVTISQVAQRAGVSIATVSRVMNRIPTVNPALGARVRAVAEELEYRPSALAQGLASGSTRTVGVVVPDLANPYFHHVIKGIAGAAGLDDHHMLVADSDETPAKEKALAVGLLTRVDGLILVSPRMDRSDLIELAETGRPIVSVTRAEEGLGIPTVSIDSGEGIVALVGHLVRLGHRDLVYLAGPKLSWSNTVRYQALTQMASFGVEITLVECGAQMEDGRRVVDDALATGATAFVAYNDLVALGLISALGERSILAGRQVSVTGFDDIPMAGWWTPALTTVRTPQRELGVEGWRLLREIMGGERYAVGARLLPELVVRDSTGPVASPGTNPRPVDRTDSQYSPNDEQAP